MSAKIENLSNVDPKTTALLKKMILEWPCEKPLIQFFDDLYKNKTLSEDAKYIVGAIASCVIACLNTRSAYENSGDSSSLNVDFVLAVEENTHSIINYFINQYPNHAQQAENFEIISKAYSRWKELADKDSDFLNDI
ncbi:hypothetical protein [Marinomonas fungiae]|uniref:hypothetical protein n=1 Tax=Marinomonas fungiae TaxID=1137284 RepID=UPI0011474DD9|nr:hypothetical protein [Marinomonas fungiae]